MKALLCRAAYCTEEVDGPYDVCGHCWAYRGTWLDPMTRLWVRVHGALAPSGSSALTERVAVTRPGPSMPLRTAPVMAMEAALAIMTLWADTFRRMGCAGHLPERNTVRDGYLFARAVVLCRTHDYELDDSPLRGDYYLDVYRAYWGLCRVDNSRADTVRLAMPCPACDCMTLVERNAGEFGQCLTCGRKWSQAALSREIHGAA